RTRASTPSRTTGWSSTTKIRIAFASSLMTSSHNLAGKFLGEPRAARGAKSRVCTRGWNAQFHFCARFLFAMRLRVGAPHRQLASYAVGPLAHAAYPKVPWSFMVNQKLRIDAFPVVPHAQPELPHVISDFYFDTPRVGVAKSVAQSLSRHAIHLVAQD